MPVVSVSGGDGLASPAQPISGMAPSATPNRAVVRNICGDHGSARFQQVAMQTTLVVVVVVVVIVAAKIQKSISGLRGLVLMSD